MARAPPRCAAVGLVDLTQAGQRLPLSREAVLQQIGELLYFRGTLNLHSEVLFFSFSADRVGTASVRRD